MWTEQHASKTQVSNLGGLPKAIGEVRYRDRQAIDEECRYFNTALSEQPGVFVEPFMSAPSPGMLAMAMKNEHYDTLEAYLNGLGKALQVEYEAIVQHGFLLQVDAPDLALERHITYKNLPTSAFVEFVEQVIAVINKALVNVPRDRVRLHVCWGNSESPHDADVPLEDILPALMRANVGGFVLPFSNPRHAHEFNRFAKLRLADDQILVAGVIDSLTNFVEYPEVVADRIERVAAVVSDPTRVMAGTDCGFDTSAGWGGSLKTWCGQSLQACGKGRGLLRENCFAAHSDAKVPVVGVVVVYRSSCWRIRDSWSGVFAALNTPIEINL